jgi:hypothetical protein
LAAEESESASKEMARPKKQPHERRSASVRSDLTLAEKCYVQEQAARAGLSEAEYVRRRALDYAVKIAPAARSIDSALASEINRLGNQLAALGNVVNQVALYCHTDRRMPSDWTALPREIKALQQVVSLTLERILLDDGS